MSLTALQILHPPDSASPTTIFESTYGVAFALPARHGRGHRPALQNRAAARKIQLTVNTGKTVLGSDFCMGRTDSGLPINAMMTYMSVHALYKQANARAAARTSTDRTSYTRFILWFVCVSGAHGRLNRARQTIATHNSLRLISGATSGGSAGSAVVPAALMRVAYQVFFGVAHEHSCDSTPRLSMPLARRNQPDSPQ